MRRRHLRIVNRTEWPTWFIRFLAERIAKRAGITWPYKIVVDRPVRREEGWYGLGWRSQCEVHLNRRPYSAKNYPVVRTDHRFRISPVMEARSSVEVLIQALGHEMSHATVAKGTVKNGRWQTQKMECIANGFSKLCVEWWRESWRKELRRAGRQARNRTTRRSVNV